MKLVSVASIKTELSVQCTHNVIFNVNEELLLIARTELNFICNPVFLLTETTFCAQFTRHPGNHMFALCRVGVMLLLGLFVLSWSIILSICDCILQTTSMSFTNMNPDLLYLYFIFPRFPNYCNFLLLEYNTSVLNYGREEAIGFFFPHWRFNFKNAPS